MNFYSDAEHAACEQDISNLVDTFGTPISMYKTSEELLISQDPNYIFTLDSQQQSTQVSYVTVSGTFIARIKYLDKEDMARIFSTKNRQLEGNTQLRLDQSNPIVRLKLGQDAYDFIDDFQRAQFDNNTWTILRAIRWHGLFTRNYYTIYLQQTN